MLQCVGSPVVIVAAPKNDLEYTNECHRTDNDIVTRGLLGFYSLVSRMMPLWFAGNELAWSHAWPVITSAARQVASTCS